MRKVRMKVKDLRQPIYHDELPVELVERASKLFPAVKTLFPDYTLQDWIDGFKHDLHPEWEIANWEWMVGQYESETKGKILSKDQAKAIWREILIISQ